MVGSLRVLLASDRARVAAHLSAHLRILGHEVVGSVTDGRAAVEAARGLRPDLAILELRLPALDGIEAAQAILTARALPIILCAHYVTADVVRRARRTGIMAWLSPRADPRELAAVITVAQTRFEELRILAQEGILSPEGGDWTLALQARAVVESAKRAVMGRLGLLESEAFRYLRRQSQRLAVPLPQVAGQILDADELLFGEPGLSDCLRAVLVALARSPRDQPVSAGHGAGGASSAIR